MLNVEKPAPSIVAIAALLRNCATTEPSPALLVGIVLTTTCFRGASTWAFVNEMSFSSANSERYNIYQRVLVLDPLDHAR